MRVASDMFPRVYFNNGVSALDISKRIEIEISNVANVIKSIIENNITYRDLFHFSDGYNAGYTYVYSRGSEFE
jgi:predicted transcriptional regulator